MNNLRQVGLGLLVAVVSVVILFGSLSLAMLEGAAPLALSPAITWTPRSISPTPSASPFSSITLATPAPSKLTLTGSPKATLRPNPKATTSPTPTSSPTGTLTPPPTAYCKYPSNWSPIILQSGDTLKRLASTYQTTEKALVQGNCMVSKELIPGALLYIPDLPMPQKTITYGPPLGWVYYVIKPGDTLSGIAMFYGTTVQQLMSANRLESSTIWSGQRLLVPERLRNITPAGTQNERA